MGSVLAKDRGFHFVLLNDGYETNETPDVGPKCRPSKSKPGRSWTQVFSVPLGFIPFIYFYIATGWHILGLVTISFRLRAFSTCFSAIGSRPN